MRGSSGTEFSEALRALGTQFLLWRFLRQGAPEFVADEVAAGAWPSVCRPSSAQGPQHPGIGTMGRRLGSALGVIPELL